MRTFMKNTMLLASKTISIAACVLSLCMNQPLLAQFMEFENVKVSSDGTAMMLSTGNYWDNPGETKIYRWSALTGLVPIKTFPANTDSDIKYGNADGTTAIGTYGSGSGDVSKVWRWTSIGGFNDAIGLAGYAHSELPDGLELGNTSADGTVIAGYSYNGIFEDSSLRSRAFRWVAGTTTDIGVVPDDTDADMYGGVISSDGTVMFGRSWNSTTNESHAFRWQKTTGTSGTISKIADLGNFEYWQTPSVQYINSNGTILVASTYGESGPAIMRWTSAGLNSNIGLTGFTGGHAVGGVSSDGTVIAGYSFSDSEWNDGDSETTPYKSNAFRWVAGTGTTGTATPLGFLPGDTDSDTYGWDNKTISSDGTVIVGRSWHSGATGMQVGGASVFRWVKNASNKSGVMTKIIDIPVNGDCDVAYINANGTTIVGSTSSYGAEGSTSQIWRWTSAGGLNSTIGLPTYSKHYLSSVSSDGTVIAGNSFSDSEWNGESESTPYKSNAFRWVATTATGNAGTTTALGHLAGDTDEDLDMYGSSMSLDGSVIVGMSWNSGSSPTPVKHAFRWQKTTGNSGVMTGITQSNTAPPSITSITPATGSMAGGTTITINGTNFTGASSVTIGGVEADVTFISATKITVLLHEGTPGAQNVVVSTSGGTVTSAGAFTYVAPVPTITSVTPNSGSLFGGTAITITGTNFIAGATVQVGALAALSVEVVSPTSITAVTPAGATGGAQNVLVITAGGTATKTAAFSFVESDIANSNMDFNYINANGTTVVGEASTYSSEGASTSSILRSTSAGINAAIGLNGYPVHYLS